MNPLPIQKPRPPIIIAANQPRMLKNAVRYANTWTTLGSAEGLEDVRKRNTLVDKYCNQLGRDPRTLRRSFWLYEHNALASNGLLACYESEDVFSEMVKPFIDMGMNEILVSYPYQEEQTPVFEKIAKEVIPELKEEYNK